MLRPATAAQTCVRRLRWGQGKVADGSAPYLAYRITVNKPVCSRQTCALSSACHSQMATGVLESRHTTTHASWYSGAA